MKLKFELPKTIQIEHKNLAIYFNSREGSLCSPAARLGQKYLFMWVCGFRKNNIYCDKANLFEIINHSSEVETNFCTLRAQGVHEAIYYFGKVNIL